MEPQGNPRLTITNLGAVEKAVEGVDQDETVRIDEKQLNTRIDFKESEAETIRQNGSNKQNTEAVPNIEVPISWDDCDFETAIDATGYGKYNIFIMAVSVFPMLSCLFATSTMSLILPSAECDLGLSNFHKGLLNASTYTGMICSAFFWGFLSDTLGRQKLLVISFALDCILNLTAALAQSFEILFAAKLLAGFICSGPFAILMTYLAECHSAKHRASIIQWTGVFSALGTVGLPLLAWAIIPKPWYVEFLTLELPSWRIFLVVCTIPAIISSISFYFQHESPKFLMSQGRNDEAMKAFQTIYALNSGKPKSTYPVRTLIIERVPDSEKLKEADEEENGKTVARFFKMGWQQIRPLFHPPHLRHAVLLFTFQGGSLFGLNTLRLWMPQLFSSILNNAHLSANASTVCELLVKPEEVLNATGDCSEHLVNGQVYINSIVIGAVTAIGYLTSGYLVKALGKKWLIIGCTAVAVVCSMLMYWAKSSNLMLGLSSLFITLTSVSTTAIISVVVDLFPTSLRTMAVSLTMMFGRMGAMTGNLIFPLLLDWDCTVPFFLLAAVIFGAGTIVFFIPKTKGKALE